MTQLLDQGSQPATARFTAKQGQYLAFIWAYSQINRRAPAEADFQRYFKVSAPSVHQMLKTLDQLGLIDKQPRVARSIQLCVPPQQLPILGLHQPVIFTATGHYGLSSIEQYHTCGHVDAGEEVDGALVVSGGDGSELCTPPVTAALRGRGEAGMLRS